MIKAKNKKIEKDTQRSKKIQGGFVAVRASKRSLEERRTQKKRSIDPVYGGERRRMTDRRRAKGPLLPTIYLLLELTIILLLIYTAYEVRIPILYYISIIIGAYYFFASCLPRYRIVLKRQKYYLNPQKRGTAQ